MGNSNMDELDYVKVETCFQQGGNFLNIHVAKPPWLEKGSYHIVESTQLNTICVA